ncbi:MAG: hypothetical protein GVY20_12880, partial [Bacteroidetes bacterium]|nr:hypothetical protein [Bacteroidota bacterium]
TGREITWDEILTSDLRLGPSSVEFGRSYDIPDEPPKVGTAPAPANRYS